MTPEQIIEAIIDDLAMGELGLSIEGFRFTRLIPETRRLDYGELGAFDLTVRPAGVPPS